MDTWIDINYPFAISENLQKLGSVHFYRLWNAYYIPAICFMIIGILYLYWDIRKPKNFPPGPPWYPILGCGLALELKRREKGMLWQAINDFAKQYDKAGRGLVGFKVGKDRMAVVYRSETIREMMTNEVMDGRPTGPFYETRTWNMRLGVLLTDSDFWMEQRRFIVRHLKDFGFARQGMVEICHQEADSMFQDLMGQVRQNGGSPIQVEFRGIFSVYVLNTLWCMMAGKRYPKDNSTLMELQETLHELFLNIDMVGATFSHFPILRFLAPEASGFRSFIRAHERIFAFIGEELKIHIKNFDPENEPLDLMDAYLKAMSELTSPTESFSERQLLAVCLDMFLAGSETTNKSLDLTMVYVVRNPDVQRRMQQEIDNVIGRARLPSLEDRANLPFCEAVVLEGLRIFMGNTFGIPHRALVDTQINGYFIPKDTMVIAGFFGMNFDKRTFAKPDEFQPELHFMRDGKVHVPDSYQPFGYGRRRCMGEKLARNNLFLFVTTIVQNFSLAPPQGVPIPSDECVDGATPSVHQYKVVLTPR